MSRRSRLNWPLWITLATVLCGLALYVSVPVWQAHDTDEAAIAASAMDAVMQRSMTVLACLWFFVFGATIGSFLNVVAHRMPIGMTIVTTPSRCPYCMTPIRFRHNVPILGWLVLRGRCAQCKLPISPRYWLVELVVGLLFLSLFCALVVSGGANLPVRTPHARSGVMWNLFTPQWDLIGIYFFHAFLLGTLVTISLIKWDRLPVPSRLGCFAIAVGILCPVIWPQLHPVPALAAGPDWFAPWERIADPLIGLVAGLGMGTIVLALTGSHTTKSSATISRSGSLVVFGLVGAYLGWQTLVPVLVLAALFQLLATFVGGLWQRPTDHLWAMSATLGTWTVLCGWRQLPLVWLPGPASSLTTLMASTVFGFAVVYLAQSISSQ